MVALSVCIKISEHIHLHFIGVLTYGETAMPLRITQSHAAIDKTIILLNKTSLKGSQQSEYAKSGHYVKAFVVIVCTDVPILVYISKHLNVIKSCCR